MTRVGGEDIHIGARKSGKAKREGRERKERAKKRVNGRKRTTKNNFRCEIRLFWILTTRFRFLLTGPEAWSAGILRKAVLGVHGVPGVYYAGILRVSRGIMRPRMGAYDSRRGETNSEFTLTWIGLG